MFYKLLQRKRDEWLRQENCPINSLLSYIQNKGMMRDAQIEAIKTYLFLKISCNNKPLWKLFTENNFLSIDVDSISLTSLCRNILVNNKAVATLYEYACLKDEKGNTLMPSLKEFIERNPDKID